MNSRDQTADTSSPLDAATAASVPVAEQLRLLEEQLRLRLTIGSERIKDDEIESAELLRREAGYMAENIEAAIRNRLGASGPAVQRACDYLGWRLHELRWVMELKTEENQQAMAALLESLEPQVSECWRNALRFLEAGDLGMARQHFASMVTTAPIRHMAYQHLGFLASRMGDSKEAVKNFDLARRHAESERDRALASSHLGGSWFAAGDPMRAAKAALNAAEACPDEAKYWYETAVYCASLGKHEHLEEFLSNAIRRDWLYWPMAIVDPNLAPARAEVARLLGDMREQQRIAVRSQLDKLRETVAILRDTEAAGEVLSAIEIADDLEREFQKGSIFTYLRLSDEIPEAQKQFLRRALEGFDKRLRQAEAGLGRGGPDNRHLLEQRVDKIKAMRGEADEKEKPGRLLLVFRTLTQLWSAIAIPAAAWGVYDWLGAIGAERLHAQHRLAWLMAGLCAPWLFLLAMLFFLHRLPAKLIRQRARDMEGELEKSTDWQNRKSVEEQSRMAEDLDRLMKQRDTVAEYLRGLES